MRILNKLLHHDRAYVEMAGRERRRALAAAAARAHPKSGDWLYARMVARMTKTHGGVSSVANEKAGRSGISGFSGSAGADGRPPAMPIMAGGRKNGSAGGAAHIGGIANAGGVAHSGGAAKAGGSAAGGSAWAGRWECERNCGSRAAHFSRGASGRGGVRRAPGPSARRS